MTTSPLSTPTTALPVEDDKNLLMVSDSSEGSSCCGGSSCGTN